jgi:hypothetical protein
MGNTTTKCYLEIQNLSPHYPVSIKASSEGNDFENFPTEKFNRTMNPGGSLFSERLEAYNFRQSQMIEIKVSNVNGSTTVTFKINFMTKRFTSQIGDLQNFRGSISFVESENRLIFRIVMFDDYNRFVQDVSELPNHGQNLCISPYNCSRNIDIVNAATSIGSLMQIFDPHGGPGQIFSFSKSTAGEFQVTNPNSNLKLGVPILSKDLSRISLAANWCSEYPFFAVADGKIEMWRLYDHGKQLYSIYTADMKFAWDIRGGDTVNHTPFGLFHKNPTTQKFYLYVRHLGTHLLVRNDCLFVLY